MLQTANTSEHVDRQATQRQRNVDKRARKRATDRESQRLSRARNKAYISQLEKTIQGLDQLGASDALGCQSPSAMQIKRLLEENQQLKTTLSRVNRITKQLTDEGGETAKDLKPLNAGWFTVSENGLSHADTPQTGEHGKPSDVSTWYDALDSLVDTSLQDSSSPFLPPEIPMLLSRTHCLPMNSLAFHLNESQMNHFSVLNTHMAQLECSDPNIPYSSAEVDSDIAIRAILYGWANAKRKHAFDPVWQGLEALDQGLFYRSKTVERIAIVHVIRSLMTHKIAPTGQPLRQIPPFIQPSHLQRTIDHPCLIDYFVWPDLRDTLVLYSATYASELSTTWFATNLRFEWPYRTEDICKYAVATDLYSFTDEFQRALHDLRSWPSPFGDPHGAIVKEVFRLEGIESTHPS